MPGDLEQQIGVFIEHYNHVRYRKSLNNLTPADVYFDRAESILAEPQRIKRATITNRRLQHQLQAAKTPTLMRQSLLRHLHPLAAAQIIVTLPALSVNFNASAIFPKTCGDPDTAGL
jgi:hypothetical protein